MFEVAGDGPLSEVMGPAIRVASVHTWQLLNHVVEAQFVFITIINSFRYDTHDGNIC
jgi:hypothetical protein